MAKTGNHAKNNIRRNARNRIKVSNNRRKAGLIEMIWGGNESHEVIERTWK